ncbi:hypothetical protein, partial [Escherichia coli]|uniref:hypothetical protein n=1 Tax=Escherichia coli TaxID=562 RepID=UPI001BDCB772
MAYIDLFAAAFGRYSSRIFAAACGRLSQDSQMNWITDVLPPKIRSFLKRDTPENLWVKCPETGQMVFHKDLETNL